MNTEFHGKHLIAGKRVATGDKFHNEPVHGEALAFSRSTVELVNDAVEAARGIAAQYGETTRAERAAFLRKIAEEIDSRGDLITKIGTMETGLPDARLVGERGRTVGQLRLFADHIEAGDYLDRRHDPALPDRAPLPRPDLKLMQVPIGPVAVFGASNFPLAFSVAGGDTASALAAGCPVVVKGHSAHPGTSEVVAEAIQAAVETCNMPAGVFSLLQGGNRAVGQALVQHPAIKAVGFTGSLAGGRAMFDLCAARPDPIPFFGELGSVNPVFILPEALASRGDSIAEGWAQSLTMGAGQFCTNPGIIALLDGPDADAFVERAVAALRDAPVQDMLTSGIGQAYDAGVKSFAAADGVTQYVETEYQARQAAPRVFEVSFDDWKAQPQLQHEVFGPAGIIVRATSANELIELAEGLEGQLTATLQFDDGDTNAARNLVLALQHRAGRILANGFPTGVEVADSMVHGGPYPASTNFGATSVGTMSIRRWVRPVCYQDLPDTVLPADLRT